MSTESKELERLVERKYEHGFVTDIEADTVPPGLNEDVIRMISAKKSEPEWLLEWRLEAYRHWQTLAKPDWAKLNLEPIDYQAISYFSAPKSNKDRPQSLDDVDPKLLEMFSSEKNTPKTCIVITVEEVFLHCAKALMRSKLWSADSQIERSAFPTRVR